LKSFESLTQYNGAGYLYETGEGGDSLGAGVLHFRANHSFINYTVHRLDRHYNPEVWGAAGPLMLIAAMKEYCQMEDIFNGLALEPRNKTNNSDKKCDLTVFPQRFFYPYSYESPDLETMFNKNSSFSISRLADTFSVHFYGKLSSEYRVKPGDHSIYDFLASSHCQVVYEYVKLNGLLF
jgi:hypothetical protein